MIVSLVLQNLNYILHNSSKKSTQPTPKKKNDAANDKKKYGRKPTHARRIQKMDKQVHKLEDKQVHKFEDKHVHKCEDKRVNKFEDKQASEADSSAEYWQARVVHLARRGRLTQIQHILSSFEQNMYHALSEPLWTDKVAVKCLESSLANDWVEMATFCLQHISQKENAQRKSNTQVQPRYADVCRYGITKTTVTALSTKNWKTRAVLLAVQWRANRVLTLLLAAKADADAPAEYTARTWFERNGENALTRAASSGFDSAIAALLHAKADVDWYGNCKKSALDFAVEFGHVRATQLLLDAKADVDGGGCGLKMTTPICLAAGLDECTRFVRSRLVQLLVNAKARANVPSYFYCTPLQRATHIGCIDTVRVLLSARANVRRGADFNSSPPFLMAAKLQHVEIAQLFIGHMLNKAPARDDERDDERDV